MSGSEAERGPEMGSKVILPHAWQTYPYLFANLIASGVILIALRFVPSSEHRRLALRLGLTLGLTCLLAPLFFRDYWNPARVLNWPVGIEDVLCAWNLGTAGCLPMLFLMRPKLTFGDESSRTRHWFIGVLLGLCVFMALWVAGMSSMSSVIVAQFIAAAPLLALRLGWIKLCLANGAVFALTYCGAVRLFFWIWPDLISCWEQAPPWGTNLFGVPLGEFAWALSFGMTWPVFASSICGGGTRARAIRRPLVPAPGTTSGTPNG